jgi:hypothetical protein
VRALVSVVALVLAVSGCEDPLKDAQRLEEARVIGVRVSAESGPASLVPGESALVDVLVAGPEGPIGARLAYEFCEAVDSERGVPYCAADAFAEGTLELDGSFLSVDVPDAVPEGARLALLGVVCVEGEPELAEAPLAWRCSTGDSPLRLSFDAWTMSSQFDNDNPDLSGLSVSVGDVEVPLDDLRASASCEAGAPEIENGTHRIELRLGAGAREPGDGSSENPGETLQLSHFSTSGRLERSLSFIALEADLEVALEWDADAADTPVKHYVVVRDGRGGVSFASFSFCTR